MSANSMADELNKSGKSPMNSPQKLPVVLEGLRAVMQTRLDGLMKHMLSRLEEIIYQWCQGLSDSEQQHYMDIIIEIRRNRSQIEMDVSRAIANSFLQLPNLKAVSDTAKKAAGFDKFDFDSLSLVDSEDMEITITVDSMVARQIGRAHV